MPLQTDSQLRRAIGDGHTFIRRLAADGSLGLVEAWAAGITAEQRLQQRPGRTHWPLMEGRATRERHSSPAAVLYFTTPVRAVHAGRAQRGLLEAGLQG